MSLATQSQMKIRETFDLAVKTSAFQPSQITYGQSQNIDQFIEEKEDDQHKIGTDALTT